MHYVTYLVRPHVGPLNQCICKLRQSYDTVTFSRYSVAQGTSCNTFLKVVFENQNVVLMSKGSAIVCNSQKVLPLA